MKNIVGKATTRGNGDGAGSGCLQNQHADAGMDFSEYANVPSAQAVSCRHLAVPYLVEVGPAPRDLEVNFNVLSKDSTELASQGSFHHRDGHCARVVACSRDQLKHWSGFAIVWREIRTYLHVCRKACENASPNIYGGQRHIGLLTLAGANVRAGPKNKKQCPRELMQQDHGCDRWALSHSISRPYFHRNEGQAGFRKHYTSSAQKWVANGTWSRGVRAYAPLI
jgi:hypothetical protein